MEIYMFLIAFPFLCIVFVLLYLFFKKELKQPEPATEDMRGSVVLATPADKVVSFQRDTPKQSTFNPYNHTEGGIPVERKAVMVATKPRSPAPSPIPPRSTALRETRTTHYSNNNDTTATDLLLLAALVDAMESKPTVMACPPAPEYRPDSYSTPAPSPSYNSCRSDSYSSSSDSCSSSDRYSSSDSGSSFDSDD